MRAASGRGDKATESVFTRHPEWRRWTKKELAVVFEGALASANHRRDEDRATIAQLNAKLADVTKARDAIAEEAAKILCAGLEVSGRLQWRQKRHPWV